MLKLAVNAQLPLIAVRTRDTLNFPDVLLELTGKKPVAYLADQTALKSGQLYYHYGDTSKLPLTDVYARATKAEASIVLVNPARIVEPMFDAGEVPVPKKMVLTYVKTVVGDLKKAHALVRALGGCTLKEVAELVRLTMAREGSLTPAGISDTRRMIFQGSSGLTQVDVHQAYYAPDEDLYNWMKRERTFFLEGTDHRLIPRGLLFDGPPGTGKSAGAKYIASQLGIPLYRVDIGGTKNKYVGTSEANMLMNLSRLDHEEPCVALLDEVEKVFAATKHDTSGTTQTMLSQLLWWLAEHRSRVLTVMTTNNASKLPKELYREGRIDKVMVFNGLVQSRAADFVAAILKQFEIEPDPSMLSVIIKKTPHLPRDGATRWAQAALTTAVYNYVKQLKLLAKKSS